MRPGLRKEYVDRMKEGQNDIFYITGASSDQREFIALTHGAKSSGEHMPYTALGPKKPEVHSDSQRSLCLGERVTVTRSGESIAAVSSSPFLETLRKKGIEVPQP